MIINIFYRFLVCFAVLLIAVGCNDYSYEKEWDNPLDKEGINWNPPQIESQNDTIISYLDTFRISLTAHSEKGEISAYFIDLNEDNAWDDSSETGEFSFACSRGGGMKYIWAAKDMDGIYSLDSFNIFCNKPPIIDSVVIQYWSSWSDSLAKGILSLLVVANDPDGKEDLSRYVFTIDDIDYTVSQTQPVFEIENLDSNILYNYRIVVADENGDSVINEGSFHTPFPPCSDGGLDKFVDQRDGNVYSCIKMDDQIWMGENLRYRTDMESYCYNDNPENCKLKGRLYPWNTIMEDSSLAESIITDSLLSSFQGICPDGWHIPTSYEWNDLLDFVTDSTEITTNISQFLKSDSGWVGNGNGVDQFQFTAIPAGYRDVSGRYSGLGEYAYWWSSSQYDSQNAKRYYMGYWNDQVFSDVRDKENGYSLRCVKNF